MEIIQATAATLDELISFYQVVADHMEERAIRQWHWGRYPNEDLIRRDVEAGRLYYLPQDDEIAAAVVVETGQDPEYEALSWNCGIHPGVFHRLAVHPSMQGAGLGGLVLDDVQQMLRRSGCDCVRCDTSEKNRGAIRLYEKMGFRLSDHMRWPDSPDNYLVFDKPLKRETPIWPIRMVPAFRDGALTPWGGNRLAELFGKKTQNECTGESLEVSCIPGLESTDPMGRKLPELIREHGEKLIGRCVDEACDVAAYDRNRQALYNGLTELGFECVKPQGAFYLSVKSPVPDEKAFVEAGKKYNILMVPGSSFACPGYVRLAYCVSYETIMGSLPKFAELAKEMGLRYARTLRDNGMFHIHNALDGKGERGLVAFGEKQLFWSSWASSCYLFLADCYGK